jgi:hypothetical protein
MNQTFTNCWSQNIPIAYWILDLYFDRTDPFAFPEMFHRYNTNQSLISMRSNNQTQVCPFFSIDDKPIFILDFYHDPDQFKYLTFTICHKDFVDLKRTISLYFNYLNEESFLSDFNNFNKFLMASSDRTISFCHSTISQISLSNSKKGKISKHKIIKFDKQIDEAIKCQKIFLTTNATVTDVSKILKIPYHRVSKIHRNLAHIDELKAQRNKIYQNDLRDKNENQIFMEFFKNNPQTHHSLQEIYISFKRMYPELVPYSKSWFHKKFIQGNQISFKKTKIKNLSKNEEFKNKCRIIFISKLFHCLKSNNHTFFFDESTFEYLSDQLYGYAEKGQRSIKYLNYTPYYLKLFMIVDMNQVHGFQLTFNSTTGDMTYNFINDFLQRQKNKMDCKNESIVLILDNSPKNRIQRIKNLAINREVTLYYTVPTSPFTNFIENLFNIIKKKTHQTFSSFQK